jgi:hypothetical protein
MPNDLKIRSADDLIVQEEAIKLGKPIPEIKQQKAPQEPEEESKPQEVDEDVDAEEKAEEAEPQDQEEKAEGNEEPSGEASEKEDEVDDYGTKVGKKKLYTEDEVQRMIRDRLSRGRNAPAPTAEVQAAAKEFTPDEASPDSWETQLEDFIETTISKREQKAKETQWQEHERTQQIEFEEKFTSRMAKYKDFEAVVANKPITNAMMMATRSMEDPAAFIYAAAKNHAKDLDRIAKIQDPLAQGVEIGRLEERMKKSRNLPSSPKPAKVISGDSSNPLPQLDIDARIAQHAKTKIMVTRRS